MPIPNEVSIVTQTSLLYKQHEMLLFLVHALYTFIHYRLEIEVRPYHELMVRDSANGIGEEVANDPGYNAIKWKYQLVGRSVQFLFFQQHKITR